MKQATIVLVVRYEGNHPSLVDVISDDDEVSFLDTALTEGDSDPLRKVYHRRQVRSQEENEFGDYVEDVVSQPFLKPDIKTHGVQWLKSKARIEEFQKTEVQAAKIIADYAYKLFQADASLTDFSLVGSYSSVRVRVLVVHNEVRGVA